MRACVIDFGGSYQLSIRCAPFEALYGRKCRSLVLWAEIGESSLTGPELVLDTTDKVVLIKEKLKAARDHQKSYVDKRRKPLEIEVCDGVLLKVSPWKSVKWLADANLHVSLNEIKIDKTLHFVEELEEIIDREIRNLKRSKIPLVKVHWNSKRGPEFTWEREDHMKSKYPQLFVDRAVESAIMHLVILLLLTPLCCDDIHDVMPRVSALAGCDITLRLYDSYGVHHMSTEKGIDIYMLIEKEYPLSRGTLTQMLVVKLLVEQDNKMSRELLRKIFMQSGESSAPKKPIIIKISNRKQPDPETPILTTAHIGLENLIEAQALSYTIAKNLEEYEAHQEDPDTRIDPKSHKESLEAEKVVEYVSIDEENEKEASEAEFI
ncbi:hypothetical protein Tco_0057599 [Tanacetum coccineum]